MRRMILILPGILVASAGVVAGCGDKSEPPPREPQGNRIKVDAPYTDVDIFIPEDD